VPSRISLTRLTIAAFALLATPTIADAATPAQQLSWSPVAASSAWKRYVVNPGALVYPKTVKVVGESGAATVSDPDGLKAAGGGVTTIHSTGVGIPRLVLDLGVNTGGYVEVGVSRSNGTSIRLGYSELRGLLTPAGDNCSCGQLGLSLSPDDDPEGRTDVIGSAGAFRSPGIRGAERYIALQLDGAGTVSIDYVRVHVTHLQAPPSAYAGHFLSSDRVLNRVWYASTYTFAMDSFRDRRAAYRNTSKTVVTDGAKRDRLIWIGDLAIEDNLGGYSLRGADHIIRRSLQAFSCLQYTDGQLAPATPISTTCPPTPPPAGTPFPPSATIPPPVGPAAASIRLPEYTAWWIIALHDYYLQTGDGTFVKRMLPVVRRGLEFFRHNMHSGLFVTPTGGLVINWHPFDTAAGPDAHTNATLYLALRDAAELERRVGRGASSARVYDARVASLRKAMIARLWDPAAGAFVVNADDPRKNHTQDAQVEAIYAGVTDAAQRQRALRFIDRHLERRLGVANGQFNNDPYMKNYISPYISSTELLARLKYGDTAGALALIRRTWRYMLTAGPGTLWEKIAFDGQPANYQAVGAPPAPGFSGSGAGLTSLSHGWSGGPVLALSGYVLGIRATSPGYRTWIVAPQPGGLRFAQGQAPTPYGPVVSRWRSSAGSFTLTVSGARHTSGVIEVPLLGRRRTIAMDGKIVWDGRHARDGADAHAVPGAVLFGNIHGQHTLAWARA
jgi:alpha-L-rhamnosidase